MLQKEDQLNRNKDSLAEIFVKTTIEKEMFSSPQIKKKLTNRYAPFLLDSDF